LPMSFVVKNGSKARRSAFGAIPVPAVGDGDLDVIAGSNVEPRGLESPDRDVARRDVEDRPVHRKRDLEQLFLAGEGKQLAGQLDTALRRALHGADQERRVIVAARLGLQQVDVAENHRQQIVKVVGDAPGQLANCSRRCACCSIASTF